MIFNFHREYAFIGMFCSKHLPMVIKNYGNVKVMTLDVSSLPTDVKCLVYMCENMPEFNAERIR